MSVPLRKVAGCFAGHSILRARFVSGSTMALIAACSLAAAQTPTSSVSSASPNEEAVNEAPPDASPAIAEPRAPSPAPHRSPHAMSSTTHPKAPAAPASTPRNAGFGQLIPGVHPSTTTPAPKLARKPKKNTNISEPAATPVPNKTLAVAAPAKRTEPATDPIVVHAAKPASASRVTPASVVEPVHHTTVTSGQPIVTTGAVGVPPEPLPPAEGPIAGPAAPHTATSQKPSPVEPSPPVVAAAIAPAPPAPVIQKPVTSSHGAAVPGVWVNTETHVYHKAGSRYYGKTKTGKYMSEQEAIMEGNRPAREWLPPAQPPPR